MRNRILAGLGVAALASVGIAAPATAVTATTADLYIVHAFPANGTVPDTTVDINIGAGAILLEDVPQQIAAGPGLAAPNVAVPALGNVPAGTYNVTIALAGGGAELFDADVTLEGGKSYTAVAHPAIGGDFTVSIFENDLTTSAAGNGLITVRHTADVVPVNIFSGTSQLAGPIANTGVPATAEGVLDVPAGTYTDINAGPAAGDRAIVLGDVVLPAGTNILVHAFGPSEGEFDAVVFAISGLTTPAGIPAGEAGLVAEAAPVNGALLGGVVALLLAVMAGVALVARRTAAAASR